jgi:hypothetical protein
MTESSTSCSFIVHIYRFDPEDPRKLAGLVEPLDGSDERTPFTDSDEMAAALQHCIKKPDSRRKREKAKPENT